MKLKIRIDDYRVLCTLLFYIPLHFYICELLMPNVKIDNLIRDVVILLFALRYFCKNLKQSSIGVWITCGCLILIIYALFSALVFKYGGALNALRTYLVPMLIFYVTSNIRLQSYEFEKIHRLFYMELAVIAVYGFFQAFFLGDDFLVQIGYPSLNGRLASSSFYINGFFGYQRATGTFSSPNTCGLIISFAMASLFFNNCLRKEKHFKYIVFCLLIGLLGTLSRSSILGTIVAFFVVWVISGGLKKVKPHTMFISISICIVGFICVYIVDLTALDGLLSKMLFSSFSGAFSLTDLSAKKHLADLIEPLKIIFEHPLGLGFGNNGPMAILNTQTANVVESSVYLMMYEIGILGAIVYFVPYVALIVKTCLNRRYKYYVPVCVVVSCFVSYIFLPNVQTFEVLFYVYFFMGLYYNKSVKELYRCVYTDNTKS